MAAVEIEAVVAVADTAPFLEDKKLEEVVQGLNTAVGWKAVGRRCWIVHRVPVVLGYRLLVVDIGTEVVEIAASPRDTHSVVTAQCSRRAGLGEIWERDSPVVESIQIENY